jgi:hypothetical protein
VSKRKPLPRANPIRRFGLICIAHRRNADAGHQNRIPSSLLSERVKPPLALVPAFDFRMIRSCKQKPQGRLLVVFTVALCGVSTDYLA